MGGCNGSELLQSDRLKKCLSYFDLFNHVDGYAEAILFQKLAQHFAVD